MLIDLGFGPVNRLPHPEWMVRHQPLRGVIGHNHPVFQPLRQWSGDAIGDGRHQVDPERAQPWSEHRHRQDDPAAEAKLLGHHPHQLLVRHDIGPPDLQRLADGLRHLEAADQPVENIADRHGLALRLHPLGRDHDWQPLHQVAEDLERGRS